LFITHITKAYFLIKNSQEANAINEIRKGMELGQEKGYVNLYMWMPGVLETIVTKALDEGITVQYAQDLMRKNALFPDISKGILANWPWPLKIYTMGRFHIIKNGNPLRFSGKVQHKPLSLLKALISFGGKEISELLLTDALWPDADGVAAHSAFTTTLSRLRQLVGNEQAIQCSDGKVTLDFRYCWLDIRTFEEMLRKVERMWGKRLPAEKQTKCVDLAEKAVDMYTGAFLSGDDEPWMIAVRERLLNKHLRNIKRLGEYYEQARNLPKAIEWYTKGIEVDNLAETFYESLMKCFMNAGKNAEAAAVYKQCCNTLSSILQIDPSPATKMLYKKLKN
jgi:two-component SAPR family response regulator